MVIAVSFARWSKTWSVVPLLVTLSMVGACSTAQDVAGAGQPAEETTTAPTDSTTQTTGSPTTTQSGDLPEGFGPGPDGSGLDRFYNQQVSWTDCGSGTECASIWVPLSYSDPDGAAITIRAKRDPAHDPDQRRGSLFINPGGPGVSGIKYLSYSGIDRSVQTVYDIVGFDPRGVGQSTPVDCESDSHIDTYLASDPTPDTPAELHELQDLWSQFTAGCVQLSGPLLGHVSTVEVAQDLDVMRAVVGDRKLNYFGSSYGTDIGAHYAALFPDYVGRMVLDGAVDPLQSRHDTYIGQARGFETQVTEYLKGCVSKGNCPLGDSVEAGRTRLQQFFKELDQNPLPTRDGRPLTEGLGLIGVILPLYGKENWPYLSQALTEAFRGSGDLLLYFADLYADREGGKFTNNSAEANPAVNCLDHPESETIGSLEAMRPEFLKASPTFGAGAVWWGYGCSNWPVTSQEEQPDFEAFGAPPIIAIGTTRDPATPYPQAVALAKLLSSGVLLTRDGDGHLAYGHNDCIDDTVNKFLISGTVPPDGKTC